jgi:hypothetical protein
MPYSNTFVQVTCEGHFGSPAPGLEQWRAGFKLSSLGGGSFDPANLLSFLTTIAPFVSAYHTNASVAAGTVTYLDSLSAAYIGTDGLYVGGALQPTTRYTYGSPVAGLGSVTQPFSQACVISLRSILLRGPASHGRIYWPGIGLQCASGTGIMAAGTVGAIATAAQTMINSINTAAAARFGSGSNVSLMSKVGAGRQSPCIQVGIGYRLDSMESRENRLLEAYVLRPLTLAAAARDQQAKDLDELYDRERKDREGAPGG